MKKYFYMAVAAITALSSCSSENDAIMSETSGQKLTFTASIENDATRATYNSSTTKAEWEIGDQISINGKDFNALDEGASTTFEAAVAGQGAQGDTYTAYFPANLYNGGTPTLPATQTYTAGKFDMPMYATSTTTDLQFYNLCALLAVKVTSADITTLKSIKVKTDKALSGAFTVSGNTAVLTNANDNTKTVELVSATPLSLDAEGTTFYIAIPAQTYKYLNIYLSADGVNYTEAMATKKLSGIGAIERSVITKIDYEKNAVQICEGGAYFAMFNMGATTETEYGNYYTWGGKTPIDYNATGAEREAEFCLLGFDAVMNREQHDIATITWGSNWRIPTSSELEALVTYGAWDDARKGLYCTNSSYTNNTIFLPAAGYNGKEYDPIEEIDIFQGIGKEEYGLYWSNLSSNYAFAKELDFDTRWGSFMIDMYNMDRDAACTIRAVIAD